MPAATLRNRQERRHPPALPDAPWTLIECADFLREDPRTTRRRVARGELSCIRLPGSRRLLFDQAEIRRFVSANGRSTL
jgi:hypothetical protein